MTSKRPSTRIPRDSGSELLIEAVIRLARDNPIAKVTVRDIATEAGLQTMHVKRYFGSRNGLLIAASNRLMERFVAELAGRPLDKMFPFLVENPDVRLRLRIVNHLLDEGVAATEFATDRDSYMRIAERIANVNNVGKRTARAYALLIQLVLQGNQLMGEVNGLTTKERRDIFLLLVTGSSELPSVETKLGW